MKKIKLFTLSKMVSYLILSFLCLQLAYTQELLDPRTLTKYIDAMPVPGIMPQAGTNYYIVGVFQIRQQLHSELPATTVWAYGPTQNTASYPGATFEVTRGIPIDVNWLNNLVDSLGHHIIHPLPVDQTLHWADPLHHGISYEHYLGPVPITVHVHGGEVEPESDGHPESWFTPGFVLKGEGWEKEVYHYVNNQQATTLWYHDHVLGITRLNVYMGLAGFYLIRDPQHEPAGLPSGDYEIPIVIQDRSFYTNGALAYDYEGVNPLIHPFWVPEFFGNTIVVNGKVWPYLNVEPRKYRFRFLNGSNARFYNLKIPSKRGSFIQIGTDGGYLNSPVILNELTLGPGERADVIMDFTGLPVGTEIIMRNDARSPFPGGEFPNPQTVGQIMKFVVVPLIAPDLSIIPEVLNTITPITEATVTRTLTLNEVEDEESDEPLAGFLDGKMWDDSTTEKPHIGSTEIWEIVNLTGDAHPIHIHLVQTQLLNRQKFQVNRYLKLYEELNPIIPAPVTTNPPVAPYLIGSPVTPPANERGWKDTHKMFPGDVTRVIIRFTPQDQPNYVFDPTSEPGYVWHCHILEHEDNEMMRPMQLLPPVTSPEIVNSLRSYSLEQNYPNPFNPSTTLRFSIPQNGYITLKIYDVIGREVAILANEYKLAGDYSVKFDGSHLSSGVYFYKLIAGSYTDMKKMILIK